MRFLLLFTCLTFAALFSSSASAMITETEIKEFCANIPDNYVMNRFRQPDGKKAVKPVLWIKGKHEYDNGITIEVFKDKKHYLLILPNGDSAGGCTRQQLSEILIDNNLLPEELDGNDRQLHHDDMKLLHVNEYDLVKYYPGSSSTTTSRSKKSSSDNSDPQPVQVQQR